MPMFLGCLLVSSCALFSYGLSLFLLLVGASAAPSSSLRLLLSLRQLFLISCFWLLPLQRARFDFWRHLGSELNSNPENHFPMNILDHTSSII